MSYTYPQKDNVLSSIEYLLQERGIDVTLTYEEKEELYKDITQCVCRHHLDNIQSMMTDRLGIDLYTSRKMLDKMYLSLDKNEKPILEEFNKKVLLVSFPIDNRAQESEQLRRIMRAKLWKNSFMDGIDYSVSSRIISYMNESDLAEFKNFMDILDQTDSQIREYSIRSLGAWEDKKSILLYLGENDSDNQQDFYHKIRRETKDYLKLDKTNNVEKLLAECKAVIQLKKETYQHVAVAGEGYWANLANLVAHQNDLPALLINPLRGETGINFPITNPNTVKILLNKPNDITELEPYLPDNWSFEYLYIRQTEMLKTIDFAMAKVCWDSWLEVDGKERYGED